MKRLASLLIVSCLTAGLINIDSGLSNQTPRKRIEPPFAVVNARQYVVAILENGRQICTGFIASGFVVTAGHCVEKGNTYGARLDNGNEVELKPIASASRWPNTDVAYLRPNRPLPNGLSIITTAPDIGADLWAWQMPRGWGQPLLAQGIYEGVIRSSDVDEQEINGMHYSSINAAPGASGSPVLDSNGRVRFILVGGFSPDVGLTGTLLILPTQLANLNQ